MHCKIAANTFLCAPPTETYRAMGQDCLWVQNTENLPSANRGHRSNGHRRSRSGVWSGCRRSVLLVKCEYHSGPSPHQKKKNYRKRTRSWNKTGNPKRKLIHLPATCSPSSTPWMLALKGTGNICTSHHSLSTPLPVSHDMLLTGMSPSQKEERPRE